MDKNNSYENLFRGNEISDLCNSINHMNEALKTVGTFFGEVNMNQDENGNGFLVELWAWGLKTISKEMISKQIKTLNRIKAIYEKELDALVARGYNDKDHFSINRSSDYD